MMYVPLEKCIYNILTPFQNIGVILSDLSSIPGVYPLNPSIFQSNAKPTPWPNVVT